MNRIAEYFCQPIWFSALLYDFFLTVLGCTRADRILTFSALKSFCAGSTPAGLFTERQAREPGKASF